jgi:acetylornithine deacetylase/succinyl-diaminopimelate desuccinylase-like protein
LDPKVLRRKRERSVRLLKELIAIPSSNPHVSDKDEREIARFLREELENSGLEVKLQQVTSKPYWAYEGGRSRTRPNVIARTGTKGGRKLILNGHIDTVSGSTMKHPFEPRAEGDRLYGRGSADMKGGVAAIVAAAEAIQQSGRNLKGELVLSLVVDEETLGKGTIDFLKAEQGDFAIVAEPTQNTLGIAQAGYLDFNIYSKGDSRHGQTTLPSAWASAFVEATNVCNKILSDDKIIRERRGRLGMETTFNFSPTTFTPPPSLAWMTMEEFRVNCLLGLIPERTLARSARTAKAIVRRIKDMIRETNKEGQRNTFELVDLKPGFVQRRNAYTKAFENAMQRVLRHHKHSYVLSFCDATYIYRANIPTILFGPGKMELGHSTNEYTSIRQVKDATSVFAHAIDNILG